MHSPLPGSTLVCLLVALYLPLLGYRDGFAIFYRRTAAVFTVPFTRWFVCAGPDCAVCYRYHLVTACSAAAAMPVVVHLSWNAFTATHHRSRLWFCALVRWVLVFFCLRLRTLCTASLPTLLPFAHVGQACPLAFVLPPRAQGALPPFRLPLDTTRF